MSRLWDVAVRDNPPRIGRYTVRSHTVRLILLPKHANLRHEVAVIIPCYNAARYLARALDSVFAQTYHDYCVYVIDDGSNDDTAAVLQSYAGRIISLKQEHSGQSKARNHGIRLSESPYVAFLDADDEWLPEKLERQVTVLREAPSKGMIYSDCFTSGNGRSAGSYFERIGTPTGGRVFERFLKTCPVYTPTVIVRRECLLDVGLFDETLPAGEDYNLWLRIAAHWEVEVIPEVLAIRHVTPGSLSRTTSRELVASNVITVFEKLLETCPDLTPQERRALQVAIGWRYCAYGSYLLARGESRRSREQFLKSWRYGVHDWHPIAGIGLGFLPQHTSLVLQNIYKSLKASRPQRMSIRNHDPIDEKIMSR
jgi:glycosyltransferase involved in cell wall biosynthesis